MIDRVNVTPGCLFDLSLYSVSVLAGAGVERRRRFITRQFAPSIEGVRRVGGLLRRRRSARHGEGPTWSGKWTVGSRGDSAQTIRSDPRGKHVSGPELSVNIAIIVKP